MKRTSTVGGLVRGSLSLLFLIGLNQCARSSSLDHEEPRAALLAPSRLALKVLNNSCGANQAQDFFEVTNGGTTPVAASDVSIKFWVDDTSAASLVPRISTGGCLTNASGCFHQVSGVTVTATRFSPACGTDINHQANWEITVSTTDHTAIAPGVTWANVQTSLSLSNFASFSPGVGRWYSACSTDSQYVADDHFAVYLRGNLVPSSGVAPPPCRAPHGQQQLTGHLTPDIAKTPIVGPLSPTMPIELSVGLPVRNGSGLDQLVQQVSDPKSPSYRQYMTVPQFADNFGATASDYQAVLNWAQSKGLTVVRTFPNLLSVTVSGTAQTVEQALYIELQRRLRPDGTVFYALDREPSLDLATPVGYIDGLNNLFVSKPATGSGAPNNNPTSPEGPNDYIGPDFRLAYEACMPDSQSGAGQTVGLVGGDGFSLADINQYAAAEGLAAPKVTAFLDKDGLGSDRQACKPWPVYCEDGSLCTTGSCPSIACSASCADGTACTGTSPCADGSTCGGTCGNGKPCSPGDACTTTCLVACPSDSGCMTTGSPCPSVDANAGTPFTSVLELALDIEMVMAMAPGVDEIRVFDGLDGLQQMATQLPLSLQLSSSRGLGPNTPNLVTAFKEFAVQGQSFSAASGDAGRKVDPMDYTDLPEVTLVGGTHLFMNGDGGSYISENVWEGSGGWIADGKGNPSASTPIPAYQIPLDPAAVGGSNVFRNAPDLAMVASNIEVVAEGEVFTVFGTSASSPLWAGFLARTNQEATRNGLPPVGFANPALYALGPQNQASYNAAFTDIVPPGASFGINGGFDASTGYDLVTGLGSPKCNLSTFLASHSIPGAVVEFTIPSSPSAPAGITGGPDGNIWFTEGTENMNPNTQGFHNNVGRITPDGTTFMEFPIPTPASESFGIAGGPDGNLWFCETNSNKIGQVTPTGAFKEFVVPTSGPPGLPGLGSDPAHITRGPDGNMWFTENLGNKIGRITPSGAFAEFLLPTANAAPGAIVTGPDGNIWFTEFGVNQIGRLALPSDNVTEFSVSAEPGGITAGPGDGNIWFTEGAKVGRLNPLTGAITEFPLIEGALSANARDITSGPDGNLWIASDGTVGRLTPTGTLTLFTIPSGASAFAITKGPDNDIWFAEFSDNKIGRIMPP